MCFLDFVNQSRPLGIIDMNNNEEKRILDVNRNRITEGLRVVEDILRFSEGGERFALRIKKIRHEVFNVFEYVEKVLECRLVVHRDSYNDHGRKDDYDKVNEKKRSLISVLLKKNLRRVCEGIRVSEEITRNLGKQDIFLSFKSLRYQVYDIEKELELDLKK